MEWYIPLVLGLGIPAIAFVIWYLTTAAIVSQINRFASNVAKLVDDLEKFEDACATRPGAESAFVELADLVRIHARALDESSAAVKDGERIERQIYVAERFPTRLFFRLEVTSLEVRELRLELTEARARALTDVRQTLEDLLPDMREKLSQLPIQSGAIGVGVLTLVGIVWMSGFYGILGVPFIPLLRDFQDVALVGFGSGVLPLAVFIGMAGQTLFTVGRARDIAKRPKARAEEIVEALEVARSLRQPSFWARRAFGCLLAVFFVSIAAATLVVGKDINTFDLAVANKAGTERMGILGGVGDYYMLVRSADHRIVALPKDKLECFETVLPGSGGYCKRAESTPTTERTEKVELSMGRSEDWRSYVQREAQCWVVAPETPQPLLSPVFVAAKSEELNLGYYADRPLFWPYPKDCANGRSESCATEGMYQRLKPWLTDVVTKKSRGASLHFFGFASGTAMPGINREIGGKRAEHVALQIIKRAEELQNMCQLPPKPSGDTCPVEIQIHAIGEMPDFNWVGTQGDPTEQVVLVAACDNATL